MWSSKVTLLFNDLIKGFALIDLPMANQSFTWSNLQKSPTLAKLDRFLISTEWDLDFPLTKVEALPRVTSDHCSILLTAKRSDMMRKNKLFRFEEAWLNHGDFVSKLPSWWREGTQKKSTVLTFVEKLRHYRRRIKEWCANEFYSIRRLKAKLMEEIQDINKSEEQLELSQEIYSKREELKEKLQRVVNDETAMWRIRAKQYWLQEEDGNAKIFHSIANGRKRSNGIGIINDDGELFQTDEKKKEVLPSQIQGAFHTRSEHPNVLWGLERPL